MQVNITVSESAPLAAAAPTMPAAAGARGPAPGRSAAFQLDAGAAPEATGLNGNNREADQGAGKDGNQDGGRPPDWLVEHVSAAEAAGHAAVGDPAAARAAPEPVTDAGPAPT